MGSSPSTAAKDNAERVTVLGENLRPYAGDADPATMTVLTLIRSADECERQPRQMLQHVLSAIGNLKDVSRDQIDALSVLVFQREGIAYLHLNEPSEAKRAFSKAIQIAEVMVAEKRPRLYMVLQRYVDCVMSIARLWSRDDEENIKPSASAQPPRGGRTKALQQTPFASTELALLRCIETIEVGDSKQSDLLMLPLLELGRIYEESKVYNKAVLAIRRVIGILCVKFGHDHVRLPDLNARCDRLILLRGEQHRIEAVIRLQSFARMIIALRRLERTLHRTLHRHRWLPKKLREVLTATHNEGFLDSYLVEYYSPPLATSNNYLSHQQHDAYNGSGSNGVSDQYVQSAAAQMHSGTSASGHRSPNTLKMLPSHAQVATAPPAAVIDVQTTGGREALIMDRQASHSDVMTVLESPKLSRPSSTASSASQNVKAMELVADGYSPRFARSSFAVSRKRPESGSKAHVTLKSTTSFVDSQQQSVQVGGAVVAVEASPVEGGSGGMKRGRLRSWAAYE